MHFKATRGSTISLHAGAHKICKKVQSIATSPDKLPNVLNVQL